MNTDNDRVSSITHQRRVGAWREDCLIYDESDCIVSAAPHGGEVEFRTDKQALRLAELLPSCSGWAACGYSDDASAFDTWHETSHRISPNDYGYLPKLEQHNYRIAVTWHGYAPDIQHPDVYIGGRADDQIQKMIAESIRDQTTLEVWITESGDGLNSHYAGTNPNNLTNWLADNGVQIEQTAQARDTAGETIVHAVAEVLTQLQVPDISRPAGS